MPKEEAWKQGWNTTGEAGLHMPESEYTNTPASHNVNTRRENGITKYQTFVVCERCGDKHKTFVTKNSRSVSCKKCHRSMVLRDAHEKGFPNQDAYGNFFIAGKYKRKDELQLSSHTG